MTPQSVKEKLIEKINNLEKIQNSLLAESQQLNTTDERRQKISEITKNINIVLILSQQELIPISYMLGECILSSDYYTVDVENNDVYLDAIMKKQIEDANIKELS